MKARELKPGDLFRVARAEALPESVAAQLAATIWMALAPSKQLLPHAPSDVAAVSALGNLLFLRAETETYVIRGAGSNPSFEKLRAAPDREVAIKALIDDLTRFDGVAPAELGTREHMRVLTKAVLWLLLRARGK